MIVWSIKDRDSCGEALLLWFTALFYSLWVPAVSIHWAARELFWGQDKDSRLTKMKQLKMCEHLGEYLLFSILY